MNLLKFIICFLLPISSFAQEISIETISGKIKVLVDVFKNPEQDILFVVDNSGSMNWHQDTLSRQAHHLVSELTEKNIDFHIGVITSDTHDPNHGGRLVGEIPFVTPTTPNLVNVLTQNLKVGTSGHYQERFFDPVVAALSEPLISTLNAGFYRESATLTLIFITDTEDSSVVDVNSFIDFLTNLKGSLNKISAHAVIVPQDASPSCYADSEWPAQRIEHFISLVDGYLYNLCDESSLQLVWKNLSELPANKLLLHNIPLPMIPKFDTITVQYGTQTLTKGELKRGWVYDHIQNEIVLGTDITWTQQPKGTLLEITFVPEEWL